MRNLPTSGTFLTVLVLAMAANVAFIHPAQADERRGHVMARGHDVDWRRHEMAARHWHRFHPEPAPGVVYAPPSVVYPPPQPSPGINLVIPLDFR